MKLTVLTMLRNERDVVQSFMSHLHALFDHVVAVDHKSSDGTREYLLGLADDHPESFTCLLLDEPGYFQSELMTYLAKNLDVSKESDWIFFLDGDEFLPFKTREEFESKLKEFEAHPIISMPWKNLVPVSYEGGDVLGAGYLMPSSVAAHCKIAYQPALIPVSDYVVAQGNHSLLASEKGAALPAVEAFPVLHVPVRGKGQFAAKILQGMGGYVKMGEGRNPVLGRHWFDISQYIKQHGLSDAVLNGLVVTYGEDLDGRDVRCNAEDLKQHGYTHFVLDVAAKPCGRQVEAPNDATASLVANLADAFISDTTIQAGEATWEFSCRDGRHIVPVTRAPRYNYGPLEVEERAAQLAKLAAEPASEIEFLLEFLEPSLCPIETLTPTAWGGHIPFMFSLVSLLKPRVYVELGSHHGASFFGACQALRKYVPSSRAYAIDLWTGDEHTGSYGETVYRDFTYLLNTRYADIGNALRMSFDEAADQFAPGSVDLLHIDGLHTYEAVRNDYETWIGKMSDNGVIIFHDTNVFERGFGVWKLWRELVEQYPAFEFKHTHGLGVIALGTAQTNPVVRLLEAINSSELIAKYIEGHFAQVGHWATFEAYTLIQQQAEAQSSEAPKWQKKKRKFRLPLLVRG